jgi:hypothetical protein
LTIYYFSSVNFFNSAQDGSVQPVIKNVDNKDKVMYSAIMAENMDNKNTDKPAGRKVTILAGFLAEALDMEDEISNSIYTDYVDAKNWPKNLKPEDFQNIRKYLNVLIEDTRRHRETILGVIEQHGQD